MDRSLPESSNIEDLLAQQKQSVQARVSQLGQAYLAQASEALKRSWESAVASEMERKLEEALEILEQEFERRIALRQAELRAQSLLQADEVRARTQRESSEVLARLARQMDEAENLADWKAALLDAVHAQSRTVVMLSVSGGRVLYEGHRTEEASAEGESWQSVQTSLDQAAAISAACTTMETVVCLASERELSHAIYGALKPVENQRVFLVPVLTGRAQGQRRTAALLLLEPRSGETPDTGWLEAISILAGALHECRLLAGRKNAGAPEMLGIAPASAAAVASGTAATTLSNSLATPGIQVASKPEEREIHQRAQRFARVKVAEIRLYQSQQVIEGRAKKELFSALRESLMKAREEYSEQFLSFEGMPDYLHMEAIQTLANGMQVQWERIILGRWYKTGLAALFTAAVGVLSGQALDSAARTLRASPGTASKATLQRLAETAPSSQEGALASVALGLAALDTGDTTEALRRFAAATRRLPQLADYLGWWIAQTHVKAENPVAIPSALEPLWTATPVSPLAGRAAILAARSLLDQQKHLEAAALLNRMQSELPQGQGMALLAEAAQMRGDLTAAAAHWQSVYYGFPVSEEADKAREALAALQQQMGERYPPPMPQMRLERAGVLMEARQYAIAKDEYQRLASELAGRERDLAKVRVGAADYRARRYQPALTYLRTISVSNQEAAAERLYWLAAAARRLERLDEMQETLAELARKHRTSEWRLKALLESANPYLLQNEANSFVPMYRACAQDFPNNQEAHLCSWRALWRTWLDRKPEAEAMLREHVTRFPASDTAAPAFYFLGRAAERRGDAGAARVWWQEVSRRFPNSYYTVQAKAALAGTLFANAAESPEARQLANAIIVAPKTPPSFAPTPATTRRLERARLLTRIAVDDLAEGELRYGARNDAQPYLMALELSERSNRLGEPARGLRLFKSTASGYLGLNRTDAPERFWRAAFPFPYRAAIERNAQANGLDPYLLAGLIRQESEFDAFVVSYARAIGLTQVLPSTGREVSRKLKIRGYSPGRLKDADFNLQLGTYYLKMLANSFDGRIEPALASYNGGKSRVDRWMKWGDFHEMAEFMETIPIEQTREYGKIILRNAEIYRTLYPKGSAIEATGTTWAPPDPESVKTITTQQQKPSASKKKASPAKTKPKSTSKSKKAASGSKKKP